MDPVCQEIPVPPSMSKSFTCPTLVDPDESMPSPTDSSEDVRPLPNIDEKMAPETGRYKQFDSGWRKMSHRGSLLRAQESCCGSCGSHTNSLHRHGPHANFDSSTENRTHFVIGDDASSSSTITSYSEREIPNCRDVMTKSQSCLSLAPDSGYPEDTFMENPGGNPTVVMHKPPMSRSSSQSYLPYEPLVIVANPSRQYQNLSPSNSSRRFSAMAPSPQRPSNRPARHSAPTSYPAPMLRSATVPNFMLQPAATSNPQELNVRTLPKHMQGRRSADSLPSGALLVAPRKVVEQERLSGNRSNPVYVLCKEPMESGPTYMHPMPTGAGDGMPLVLGQTAPLMYGSPEGSDMFQSMMMPQPHSPPVSYVQQQYRECNVADLMCLRMYRDTSTVDTYREHPSPGQPVMDARMVDSRFVQAKDGSNMVVQLVLPRASTPGADSGAYSGSHLSPTNSSIQPPSSMCSARGSPPDNYDTMNSMYTFATGGPAGPYTLKAHPSMASLVMSPKVDLKPGDGTGGGGAEEAGIHSAPHDNTMPTSDLDRIEIFRKNVSIILSTIYAIFIIVLGLIVFIADVALPMRHIFLVFTVCLPLLGLLWLAYLHFKIRKFLRHMKKFHQSSKFHVDNAGYEKCSTESVSGSPGLNGAHFYSFAKDSYLFKTGRHSGSFYLRIGAAAFGFGHLIHAGLLVTRQIIYLTDSGSLYNDCASTFGLIVEALQPIFAFYQLFMIFKYSNIVINQHRELARFALMHIIAANLCLWIQTIIRETIEGVNHKVAHHDEEEQDTKAVTLSVRGGSSYIPYGRKTRDADDEDDDDDDDGLGTKSLEDWFVNVTYNSDMCVSRTVISAFSSEAAPYLYPFTIEFSLIMVGIWFIVWYNIGEVNGHGVVRAGSDAPPTNAQQHESYQDTRVNNLVIHVDCHSSYRGLFAGLFVLLATMVVVILFFVTSQSGEYTDTATVIYHTSDLILLLLMSLALVGAFRQVMKLDYNRHAISMLDDILLFIAVPCFFLFSIFTITASINTYNPLGIFIAILYVVQILLQTPFIIDGLRRCSNSYVLRYEKPGRELITFLVVCNLASWILQTFGVKSTESQADSYEFYGKVVWSLLSHITLPLTLFYRFHSSVCLVDIWSSAYEPGE